MFVAPPEVLSGDQSERPHNQTLRKKGASKAISQTAALITDISLS